MKQRIRLLLVAALLPATGVMAVYAQHPAMPPGMTHEEHQAQMKKDAELKARGAAAMGFDQNTTTHHFILTGEGGRIEVGVNDPSDTVATAQIRTHLAAIANEFAAGNFAAPFATHGETPPGVTTLQAQRSSIRYRYEDTPRGGRVVLATSDDKAREAIHTFLRYQIREHGTGDPLTVGR